jgi:hypothetical protein
MAHSTINKADVEAYVDRPDVSIEGILRLLIWSEVQEVSLHGPELEPAQTEPRGKDTRHHENSQYGQISKRSTSELLPTTSLDFSKLFVQASTDADDDDDDGDSPKGLLKTTFELNDTLFAEAELEDTDTVYLWLGVCFFVRLPGVLCHQDSRQM